MKTVASLPATEIATLTKLLEKEQIPCESRIASEESGLDITDLLVDDDSYDRACETIENWQDACIEEKRKSVRRCPKCRSQSWEQVEDTHYANVGLTVYRCKSCGFLVPKTGA